LGCVTDGTRSCRGWRESKEPELQLRLLWKSA
jgi:hypothetical protein